MKLKKIIDKSPWETFIKDHLPSVTKSKHEVIFPQVKLVKNKPHRKTSKHRKINSKNLVEKKRL